jgi:protein-disulfide isomerase
MSGYFRTAMRRAGCSIGLAAIVFNGLPMVAHSQSIQRITVAGQQAMLEKPGVQLAGASDADVRVIEYFDYNCPYCKKLAPTFDMLLSQAHKIAIVYKDWPIFGGVSVYAAKAALAAQWQGKYLVAHDALISGPRLAQEEQVDAALQKAGVDMAILRKDRVAHAQEIDALLVRNNEEARALGLKGTPGIVIGRQLLPGTANLSALQQVVKSARHEK